MKAILFEVEGIINRASPGGRGALEASRLALGEHGVNISEDTLSQRVTEMSQAHADDPFEAAMWYFFRPIVQGRGYDRKHQLRAWRELLRTRRSHIPYRFRLREGIRALLEELRFGCVDSWGDVPKLIAVGRDGEFARNALEVDGVAPIFDAIQLCEDFSLRRSDPRYLAAVLAAANVAPSQALLVSASLRPLAVAAATVGMETLVYLEGSAALGFEAGRSPDEEPTFVVASFDALCDGVIDWLHMPSVTR